MDHKIDLMLNELKDILVNSSTFPVAKDLSAKEMREALSDFESKFRPGRTVNVTPDFVYSFISRHGIFNMLTKEFHKLGKDARIIIIEGADATGKTELAERLGGKLGGLALENQAVNVFKRMFGLPKIYKTTVVDYNANVLIGLLFYIVVNTFALEMVFDYLGEGNKYAILDSSMIRTMASNITRPAIGGAVGSELLVDENVHSLIQNRLNNHVVDMLSKAKANIRMVFLYVTEIARKEQAGGRDFVDAYDTNTKYAKSINDFLVQDQALLKRAGVDVLSIIMISGDEIGGKSRGEGGGLADVLMVRTPDEMLDIEKKARLVIDHIKGDIAQKK